MNPFRNFFDRLSKLTYQANNCSQNLKEMTEQEARKMMQFLSFERFKKACREDNVNFLRCNDSHNIFDALFVAIDTKNIRNQP